MALSQNFKEIQNLPQANSTQENTKDAKQAMPGQIQVSREFWFSHFSPRHLTQLSKEPIYSTKFSNDGSLLATSF
jgi:hypothetical protein